MTVGILLHEKKNIRYAIHVGYLIRETLHDRSPQVLYLIREILHFQSALIIYLKRKKLQLHSA